MKFEQPPEKKEHLPIPMSEVTLRECAPFLKNEATAEKLQDFLDAYFGEALKNISLYRSEKLGASFPYTVVRLGDVAQKLYEEIGSPKVVSQNESDGEGEKEEKGKPVRELIFGTMFSVAAAHAFHWIEHGIDDIAKKLPAALDALARGEEPDDFEVYGIGNPAGELGEVSEEYVQSAGGKPFAKNGELYAEFLESLPKDENLPAPVYRLFGVSMGASVAAETAKSLLDQGFATQSFDEMEKQHLPYVRVDMRSPVGAAGGRFQKWQIPVGFAAEIIHQFATNKYGRDVGSREKDFIALIEKEATEKGIEEKLDPGQLKLKEKMISGLLDELRNGTPIPEGVKVNEVIGIYDPLMYSGDFAEAAQEQKQGEAAGSLGANIIEHENPNRRQFAINQMHTPAVVRENYLKRLVRAAESIEQMQAGKK